MAGLKTEELILAALEEGAAERGLDIVCVEVAGPAAHPTLRVRIDLLEGTIDMDAVTLHTAWVSEVVEALDPFPGAYELEVSSPGIERPLRRPGDFVRFEGERCELATREAIDGRRTWAGTIVGADEQTVTLNVDGADRAIPFALVKQAKLKPDFEQIMAAAKKAEKEARAHASSQACDDAEDDAE